ncbi:MAG: glycosyltransferase [Nitrospinae bacterium]|nr:glycosyltransferase [Nitrospinota bacterium]
MVTNRQTKKIKVLRIITRLNVGGPGKHAIWLTAGLDKELFETRLITGRVEENEQELNYLLTKESVVPLYINSLKRSIHLVNDFKAFFALLKILFSYQPDIIHTHMSKAGLVGRLAGGIYKIFNPFKKINIFHTFHGNTFEGYFSQTKALFFLILEKLLSRLFSNKIIVISHQQFDEICHTFKLDVEEKFRIIPLGFDYSLISEEVNKKNDFFRVGLVGRMAPIKNYAAVIEVAKLVKNEKITFHIYGSCSEDELQKFQNAIATNNLEKNIFLMGNVSDINEIYHNIDMLLLTSINEGTPLSIIEAMFFAKPVVATKVGGVPDLLGMDWTPDDSPLGWSFKKTAVQKGFICKVNDYADMADKVTLLSKSQEECKIVGSNGKEFAIQTFSKERLIQDIEGLYKNT